MEGARLSPEGRAGRRFHTCFPVFEGRTDRVWQRAEGDLVVLWGAPQ